MTEHQIALVQKSWKVFRSIQPSVVGDVFYSKLFAMHPELRRMFPAVMDGQYKKIMEMISIVVSRLERLNELTDEITALGKRHAGYGVKPWHYELVGQALLWTLQQGLGTDWSKDVEQAWTKCYKVLSDAMVNAGAMKNTSN